MANLIVSGDASVADVADGKKFSAGILYNATGTATIGGGATPTLVSGVLTCNPTADSQVNLAVYGSSNHYAAVDGSIPLGGSSVYITNAFDNNTWYNDAFYIDASSLNPYCRITQIKLIAHAYPANNTQLQHVGFFIGGTYYNGTDHSSSSPEFFEQTWTTNPATGNAWTREEVTGAGFYIMCGLKIHNYANYNQIVRFYSEISWEYQVVPW